MRANKINDKWVRLDHIRNRLGAVTILLNGGRLGTCDENIKSNIINYISLTIKQTTYTTIFILNIVSMRYKCIR